MNHLGIVRLSGVWGISGLLRSWGTTCGLGRGALDRAWPRGKGGVRWGPRAESHAYDIGGSQGVGPRRVAK
jgi:hypothetical protein